MATAGTDVPMRKYTVIEGTLSLDEVGRDYIKVSIKLPNWKRLYRYLEGFRPDGGSDLWTKSMLPKRAFQQQERFIQPWKLWTRCPDISNFQVWARADGSGNWALLPLTKKERFELTCKYQEQHGGKPPTKPETPPNTGIFRGPRKIEPPKTRFRHIHHRKANAATAGK